MGYNSAFKGLKPVNVEMIVRIHLDIRWHSLI